MCCFRSRVFKCCFKTLTFHNEVCVVGKKFKNRSIFDEVIRRTKNVAFFGLSCTFRLSMETSDVCNCCASYIRQINAAILFSRLATYDSTTSIFSVPNDIAVNPVADLGGHWVPMNPLVG